MRTSDNCSSYNSNMKIGFLEKIQDDEKNIKVREYINPAVYLETTYDMNKTPIYMNIPGSGDHPKIVKVKRCLCFTNNKECPCHPTNDEEQTNLSTIRSYSTSNFNSSTTTTLLAKSNNYSKINTSNFESDSGITVRATNSTEDLHLSIPSLTSINTVRYADDQTKEDNFRNWCAKKDEERKLQEEKEMLINEIKRKQKERQVEIERENFKRWLLNKKKEEEEIKKKELEQKLEEEKIKNELRDKRIQENELSFQLWLKKKEEVLLERKIKQQMTFLRREEDRQRRLEYSGKAYEIWLKQSKNKPKPVPLNRGLESLKSSVSVTYINPEPWVPNIDIAKKPTSQ